MQIVHHLKNSDKNRLGDIIEKQLLGFVVINDTLKKEI